MQRICCILFWVCSASGSMVWPTQSVSYPLYPNRNISVLSGKWNFVYRSDYEIANRTDLAGLNFNTTQQVPGAWDAAWGTGLQYLRGTGVYQTAVAVEANHPAALHFAACSMFCRVYVDGILLHNSSIGGFTPFWVDVPGSAVEKREIVVVTDNRFSDDLTPTQHKNYDFYQYGGLLRAVTLHVLPKDMPYVARVEVLPLASTSGLPSGEVNLTVVLGVGAALVKEGSIVTLQMKWDDNSGYTSLVHHTVGKNGHVVLPATKVPAPKVWDPTSKARPLALHTLTVQVVDSLGTHIADGITVRFGLRVIATSGRDILVNGKAMKLRGFNRHDMYPQLGPSLPVSQYRDDLHLLQETLKGNFIRGAHYPQDDRFLDLCDEQGVLIWDEALAWGNRVGQLTDKRFMTAELATANAMLDASINHPSIILWGFFNEGQSENPNATASYAAMANAFRGRDPSRLITWASNRAEADLGFEYADVISFNAYPGWYGGNASTVKDTWEKHASWVAEHWPSKPFIISETGAGAVFGKHSSNESRWSEEYQRTVDGIESSLAVTSPLIAGIALWQFSDIKVDQANTSTGRPGGINNKGLLSQWREPKLSAAAVASNFNHHLQEHMFV